MFKNWYTVLIIFGIIRLGIKFRNTTYELTLKKLKNDIEDMDNVYRVAKNIEFRHQMKNHFIK